MRRIIVAGSINMDVVGKTERHPQPGETVAGTELHFIPGGKGSNQAVAASRLGGDVHLVGKLGRDAFGDTLTVFLKGEKLNLNQLRYSNTAATGTALIIVDAHSENTIVVIPGSNARLLPGDVETVPLDEQTLVVSQFEIAQDTILKLFGSAQAVGATTILNPAPATTFIPGLMELIDYLIVNETELAFYCNAPAVSDDPAEITAQAKRLRIRNEQTILVTRGAQGVLCLHHDEVIAMVGLDVQAVDTTGAGDCCVGAFAGALAEEKPMREALEFANRAAAVSVQRLGASASLPYRSEIT